MTDRAPRPEGMTDKAMEEFRPWLVRQIQACDEQMRAAKHQTKRARFADSALLLQGILQEFDRRQPVECSRLRADGATLKVRADEALAAHSASFGALSTLSAALLDGEVDDYVALAEKIIARVRQLEADGATLRERVEAALTDEALHRALHACNDLPPALLGAFRKGILDAIFPASAPKEPTQHVHTTMGASGPCSICGVQVRCSNLKDGQTICDEPNVYCAHPKCLQPKEPTP